MKKLSFVVLLLLPFCLSAQDMVGLYKKADEFGSYYNSKLFYSVYNLEKIDNTHFFWYRTNTPDGKIFVLVDADKREKKPAFDHKKLAVALSKTLEKPVKSDSLPFQAIRLDKAMKSIEFTIGREEYKCDLSTYAITQPKKPEEQRPNRYFGTVFQEDAKSRTKSPDGKMEAYISEGNLYVKNLQSGKIKALSNDGSPYEYYSSNIYWSPDSKKIVCCKYRPAGVRKILLTRSSPAEQLQPTTEQYDYIKPGDALPVRRPVLFFTDTMQQINIDLPDVELQYYLGNFKWDDGSDFFRFDLNKRGHQEFIVYGVSVPSGRLVKVVNETSPTFVHYGGLSQNYLKKSNELLWLSERDGWKHIYLYDSRTGQVKKQLTKGEWVVKSVVNVDENKRTVIFKACGMTNGEDPYLEKYYSLDIDKGDIKVLTPENADHRVTFSSDYAYMIDNYSRVDLSPVAVLRDAKDGKVLLQIEKTDISEMVKAGWRMPEVFSAKGRDGKTDIWGIIIRPTNFDPAKKYPVIEYIYAGPHDSHVPKSFSVTHQHSGLSELGFITVQIDGMGTANRSKAFHDVCWKNLKDAGFPDRIAWMKTASQRYPEMDIERVGIYGASAGGQNAMGALLFHPDFYKVGVAACGCHDNRMDKIWWNEQWMGYPVGKEYEESSNTCNAGLLKGKLMLILGELDNNVDPSSTLQVVNALIKNNKEFEFIMLPNAGHTMGESYGERKRRDFFIKHLLNIEPPQWNDR